VKGRARAGWAGFGQRARSDAAACWRPPFPFPFFLNFFSQNLSKFIWTILKSFSPLSPKIKIVPKQKPYNFALSRIHKFQINFEIQLKTSYRFLNKSILRNLV